MIAALFDVDGTLTESRVWSGLMDYFRTKRIKLGVHYAYNLVHYFLYVLHKLGLMSQSAFREIWAKDLGWYLKGYSEVETQEIWSWVIENRLSDQWREDVLRKLDAHSQNGEIIFLVSGGPVGLLKRIAQEVGADYVVGTQHEIVDGVYTGRAVGEACQGEYKPRMVREKAAELGLGIDWDGSFAYADSISDVQLLEIVGHPVAVYPEEGLKKLAEGRGWQVFEG